MELIIRAVLYLVVLFLIMIVYTGQQHDNAAAILKDAGARTAKFFAWTVGLVVLMEVCFWMFID